MTGLSGKAQAWCVAALWLFAVGCGDRSDAWNAPFDPGYEPSNAPLDPTDPTDASGSLLVRGLTGSVALLDPALNQVLMFTSPGKLELATARLPVGRDVVQFKSSAARDRLFVLSRGVTPRYKSTDESPQLLVFDGGTVPQQLAQYTLQDPYDLLEPDPLGEWLIVHGSEGLVSNPNELILVPLPTAGGSSTPKQVSKTLNSYGGKPKRFVFTSELTMPGGGGRHRLLIVEREKDLAIIDLDDLDAPEITVGLPQDGNGGYESPSDVVYHDGIEGEVEAMLAVQLADDNNVYILPLKEPEDDTHAFSLGTNLVDVGGKPSKLAFVKTREDGGLRLAALVPSKKSAKLVDPSSSKVTDVALPVGFTQIRRITSDVSSTGQDIALLYGETTNTIAFWQLGVTLGTPYLSIDSYDLGIKVGQVYDVPGDEFADRKILAGSGATPQFYVLDLSERKSFPLDALSNLTLNLSPNGEQLWAFQRGAKGFAQLTFEPLQPSSLYTEEPIAYVHDFATERGENERSVLALHILAIRGNSTVAATLFDGDDPNTAQTRFYSQLELEGLK